MRFVFKMIVFPFWLLTAFLALMLKWTLNLSAFVLALPMLYICLLYTSLTGKLVDSYWDNNSGDILDIVDGSFLIDYDEAGQEFQFKSAAAISKMCIRDRYCGRISAWGLRHPNYHP